jgi:type VI secretion system protein ImpK
MTPKFAAAVDPVFEHVLHLLRRIRDNETIDAPAEQQQIRDLVSHAEARLGQTEEWAAAKYALVAWADDVLIETPWEGAAWWYDNPLEVYFFNSRQAYSRFYTMALEADQLPQKNALEVFYVCVVLGFRGLYRNPAPGAEAEELHLPGDLQTWAKQTARSVHLGQGVPPIGGGVESRVGAPPLDGKFLLVGSSLLAVIMAALTLVFAIVLFVFPDSR